MNANAVLRTLGFQGFPDRFLYQYWTDYVFDVLRRDLASIVWGAEKVILVVSFESWKREKVKKLDKLA